MSAFTPFQNKEQLLQLAATYQDAKTPISPDMVTLVIDTGANVTVTPYTTDFITPIHPIQAVEIKGIAAGLEVKGYSDVSYSFYNDVHEKQTLLLRGCLYIPQCTACLLCPRQIGIPTGHPKDGFHALSSSSTLMVERKPTTILYNKVSNLTILYTAPGVDTFRHFCAHICSLQPPSSSSPVILPQHLTSQQHYKLNMHERCAHSERDQVKSWIRKGILPCDPSLANKPDPICAAYQFGKAHQQSHKSYTRHISDGHTAPGDGASLDGMEAGSPGCPITTHGLPSMRHYKYATFWIDHYSQFVCITMHESKKAEELLCSKAEFEGFVAHFGVPIKCIRANNGIYTAKIIQDSCSKKHQ